MGRFLNKSIGRIESSASPPQFQARSASADLELSASFSESGVFPSSDLLRLAAPVNEPGTLSVVLAVGLAIGLLLVLGLTAMGLIVWRNRHRHDYSDDMNYPIETEFQEEHIGDENEWDEPFESLEHCDILPKPGDEFDLLGNFSDGLEENIAPLFWDA
jgi:hypothetical protein